MKNLLTFITGLGFGIGLIISGMTNPAKVIGFLDLFGQWDPSLMFVMMGAIFVSFFGFRFIEKYTTTSYKGFTIFIVYDLRPKTSQNIQCIKLSSWIPK